MASTTLIETRKQIRPEAIDDPASKKSILESIDQPSFEKRHYRKYHRCQRWTHGRLAANFHK